MPLYPLFADLGGREVLVVGGGEVALRKVEALLHAGAQVVVNAHALHPVLAGWLADGRLRRRDGDFDPAWLDSAWLLVVATDDATFNAQLAAQAHARGIFANVVDDARLSSFQVPALVERGTLVVAISSGGAAPMLARRLCERLETELDPALGELAGLFARHRAAIRSALPELARRRRWFDAVIDGPVVALLRDGRREAAETAFLAQLQAGPRAPVGGRASLVGSGPGDPAQLTLAALRAMKLADLVLHDADVDAAVLAVARKDAPRAAAPLDPDSGLQRLQAELDAGRHVVWLKSGDGFRHGPFAGLGAALKHGGHICEVHAGIA
ncbi:putative siroheme synthase [uncultured Stenotrophomonas sp.]|uniref:precorrin-2 dehydrogenase n=1 Tax=uncultured Stenotrophomonas sp. TaxID=165438 RepID=A0A1Y5Q4U6_9GAMM|nr:putative siroheme synthase [uncultured Stenotrophomonas sp.]